MGRALDASLDLIGALTTSRLDKNLKEKVQLLNKLVDEEAKKRQVTQFERLHVQVVNLWANGDMKNASRALDKITTLYPEDIYSLKLNQDTYFYLGAANAMRSSLAGAITQINDSNPLKGYAHGMYSFALEESNLYDLSQKEAMKALQLNPCDTWAIHNYAHCLEMQGKTDEGLAWMLDRKKDWITCSGLACHQYWHTALFYLNKREHDEAINLLDEQILTRCLASSSGLDLHDAASMLYRLELINLLAESSSSSDKPSRWKGVYDMCKTHTKDHIVGFNDCHYMMTYLAMEDNDSVKEMLDTLNEQQAPTLVERDTVVRPLLEAMVAFKKGDYPQVVDKIEPIRHDIVRIGGSHAQRDIFEQLLLVAALKSGSPDNKKLADRMVEERNLAHGHQTHLTHLLSTANS